MTDHNLGSDDDNNSSPQNNETENDPPDQPLVDVFHSTIGEDQSPSEAVVLTVSAVDGVKPEELECLHNYIDPEALDALIDGPVVIGDSGYTGIEFRYSGYRVTVRNNGSITIFNDTG